MATTVEVLICTADHPAPPRGAIIFDTPDPWNKRHDPRYFYRHPDAKIVGGCSEGCCDDYACPHCGYRFRVEYDG
jgi:hypothetical protein